MKLIAAAPDLRPGEHGFDGYDKLNRKEKGQQLSKLIEAVSEPMVIAIDGAWGSGKSHFLKCWVGAHTKEFSGTANTVYFDAFKHDFMDDPLLALTNAVVSRLEQEENSNALNRLKRLSVKIAQSPLARSFAKAGLKLATFGASEVLEDTGDLIVSSLSDDAEKTLDAFWQQETSRQVAMIEFRDTLLELTGGAGGEDRPNRLVIAIDELDRFRPDFALSVLETIKHFFDVPNVHFVLGVNLEELGNSVRARYGAETSASQYLQKFITVNLRLPEQNSRYDRFDPINLNYFQESGADYKIAPKLRETLTNYLSRRAFGYRVSLRDIDRINTISVLACASSPGFDRYYVGRTNIVAGFIFMKANNPSLYKAVSRKQASIDEIRSYFGFKEIHGDQSRPKPTDRVGALQNLCWTHYYSEEKLSDTQLLTRLFGDLEFDGSKSAIDRFVEETLETFSIG